MTTTAASLYSDILRKMKTTAVKPVCASVTPPTYTKGYGEVSLENIYEKLVGCIPTLNPPWVLEHHVQEAIRTRTPLIGQLQLKLKEIQQEGNWFIHIQADSSAGFVGNCSASYGTSSGTWFAVDNHCNMYLIHDNTDRERGRTFSVTKPSSLNTAPLSDSVIDSIKKLDAWNMIVRSSQSGWDSVINSAKTLDFIFDAYRAQARTEYLLHQQAKVIEESRAKNKMLEARLSVLEALLLPTQSPPKEIDLLGLHTKESPQTSTLTHDLRTAVMDASDIPSLIITDSHSF